MEFEALYGREIQGVLDMAEEIEGNWTHILINGKSTTLEVKDAQFDKGRLVNVSEIKNYPKKDAEDKDIEHTADLVNGIKRKAYKEFFQKPFKNLVLLTGAGSSMDVGGLSMWHLWEETKKMYFIEKAEETEEVDGFKIIREKVNYADDDTNLEALLSQIEGFCKFSGDCDIKWGPNQKKLSEIKEEIFLLIKNKCTIPTPPKGSFPHQVLLEKVLQRKQTSQRVKVFTLNYDLLFEDAATAVNAIVIDGFSFTFPRTFSGRYFDYDIVQREGRK